MIKFVSNISRQYLVAMLTSLVMFSFTGNAPAHPMPNSVVLLDVQPGKVYVELKLPLN